MIYKRNLQHGIAILIIALVDDGNSSNSFEPSHKSVSFVSFVILSGNGPEILL